MLLYQAAQGGRSAHDSALLGSIGVIGYAANFDQDDIKIVSSKNAKNKLPGEASVQKRIDQIESIFTQRLSIYTQMKVDDIVKAGDYGAVFTGNYAADNGFVDELSDYKTVTESLSMPPETEDNAKDQAESSAQDKLDCLNALLDHPAATEHPDAVKHFASLPISKEDAIASLDLLVAKTKKEPEPEDKKDDKSASDSDIATQVADGIKAGLSGVQDQLKALREKDNDDVPGTKDDKVADKKSDYDRAIDEADQILGD